eukprot:CAMPEP_0201713630 /NCGR_PEP_ID=MMETSP0593-20130828/399_1 /ASSEMBLY_ACC=CAM_ASM_000672 /TAXON_ID=267983 /ORGANISM="Skeletonema japonicum, Strain CCMP2506" /LENGTH=371 /DNA_ID=CAMNT_0048202803 /DNA_START=74 /DNA_END=1189 /DNA_ORIENTATION=+
MPESVASEVVSAMVGGMFSASALYPLEVLKTRMQAESKPSNKKSSNPQENNNSTDSVTNNNNNNTDSSNDDDDDEIESGGGGGKQQSLKHQYSQAATEGMSAYASLMYQHEGGIPPFYAGVGTSAVQSATEKALYFFAYTFFKNGYVNLTGSSNIGTISNLILGCMAEWAHLPVTLPIDCVTTAIQTDDKNRGAFVLLGNILSEKGIGGFYKGIQAYTVLCLKPAIQYTVYEQVKKMVLATRRVNNAAVVGGGGRKVVDESLSAAEAFFLGMVARVIATMLTYPYLRAKVMLQSTYGNAKVKPTIPQMISEQISEGGVWGLYQGIGPELTRGVFSAALMMMVKERIGVMVRELIDGREQQQLQQQRSNHGR